MNVRITCEQASVDVSVTLSMAVNRPRVTVRHGSLITGVLAETEEVFTTVGQNYILSGNPRPGNLRVLVNGIECEQGDFTFDPVHRLLTILYPHISALDRVRAAYFPLEA